MFKCTMEKFSEKTDDDIFLHFCTQHRNTNVMKSTKNRTEMHQKRDFFWPFDTLSLIIRHVTCLLEKDFLLKIPVFTLQNALFALKKKKFFKNFIPFRIQSKLTSVAFLTNQRAKCKNFFTTPHLIKKAKKFFCSIGKMRCITLQEVFLACIHKKMACLMFLSMYLVVVWGHF